MYFKSYMYFYLNKLINNIMRFDNKYISGKKLFPILIKLSK